MLAFLNNQKKKTNMNKNLITSILNDNLQSISNYTDEWLGFINKDILHLFQACRWLIRLKLDRQVQS